MAISLDIYGRADAPSAWDPVANDLVAVEKRQDKQQGKGIGYGREESLSLIRCSPKAGPRHVHNHKTPSRPCWAFGGNSGFGI
jgi:hypothetical protein